MKPWNEIVLDLLHLLFGMAVGGFLVWGVMNSEARKEVASTAKKWEHVAELTKRIDASFMKCDSILNHSFMILEQAMDRADSISRHP